MVLVIVLAVFGVICAALLALLVKFRGSAATSRKQLADLSQRYSVISDADEEARRIVATATTKASDEAQTLISAAEREAKTVEESAELLLQEARKKLGGVSQEAEALLATARDKVQKAEEDAARIDETARKKAIDAEVGAARLLAEAQASITRLRDETRSQLDRQATLAAQYATAKGTYDELSLEVRRLEESLDDISFGLYKPHYTYETPEDFKAEFDRIRDREKEMIRAGTAATASVAWVVGGSEKEGAKMQKQYTKLLLRAFNGECDAAVAKVAWNNATKMDERIHKGFEAINELGGVMKISIAPEFLKLKLAELRLEHEWEEKKKAIAEEQRLIREQMREEERAQREAEKAQEDAEAEETRFQKALDKARVELGKAKGAEHQRLTDKLLDLERQLTEAQAKSVRAKSLAQLTKAGYVYVLSNVGSFGEGVFKIGMTRRATPMDRVKELGDASVPFQFDVHAMVYCDDAPGTETAFHQQFAQRSVNLVNMRKEFFRVDLTEMEQFAKQKGLSMSFTKLAEAREFRETQEIIRSRSAPASKPASSAQERFPADVGVG
jgi:hypothetical protein